MPPLRHGDPIIKRLEVANQVRLSPLRCLGLTIAGVSYRLFRSLVTVAILALAVTFLAHGVSHSLIVHETRTLAHQQLREVRELGEWTSRLTTADTREQIWDRLSRDAQPYVGEYQQWANADDAQIAQASEATRRFKQYEAYFADMPEASSVVLLGGREVWQMLQMLADAQSLASFEQRRQALSVAPPPGQMEQMVAFAQEQLPAMLALTDRITAGHAQAVAQVRSARDGTDLVMWLATAPDAHAVLTQARYTLAPQTLDRLRHSATQQIALQAIIQSLDSRAIVSELARRLNQPIRSITPEALILYIQSADRAQWLLELRQRERLDIGLELEAAQLLDAAQAHRRQLRLQRAVGPEAPQPRQGLFDLPRATQWLMILSFLVCAVGVTNAMFMSVTERFTEIATMKCLGALDGFLMQMFLYESALQGLVGGLIGIALGIGLAILRGLLGYGPMVFAAMPWMDLVISGVLALVVGVLLAVFAAVGPAAIAARLAPMEAMRID